jgi:hypothetical protein
MPTCIRMSVCLRQEEVLEDGQLHVPAALHLATQLQVLKGWNAG